MEILIGSNISPLSIHDCYTIDHSAYLFFFIDNLPQIGCARRTSRLYSTRTIDTERFNEIKKYYNASEICIWICARCNISLCCAVDIFMSYLSKRIYSPLRNCYDSCNILAENAESGMLILLPSCASLSVWMALIYASRLWDEQLLDSYTARRLLGKKIHYMYHRAPLFLSRLHFLLPFTEDTANTVNPPQTVHAFEYYLLKLRPASFTSGVYSAMCWHHAAEASLERIFRAILS